MKSKLSLTRAILVFWPCLLPFLLPLGLNAVGSAQLTLADGTEINTDIYEVTILWEGQPLTLQVDALDSESLVGMALLKGYDLHIRAVVEGPVTITPVH